MQATIYYKNMKKVKNTIVRFLQAPPGKIHGYNKIFLYMQNNSNKLPTKNYMMM